MFKTAVTTIRAFLFGETPDKIELNRGERIIVSTNVVVVPENSLWICREIVVKGKQTHCWFLMHPFNSIYAPGRAYMLGEKVFLKWTTGIGKIKKAKLRKNNEVLNGFDIQKNIGLYPVWFPSGTKLTTENSVVELIVDEYRMNS